MMIGIKTQPSVELIGNNEISGKFTARNIVRWLKNA